MKFFSLLLLLSLSVSRIVSAQVTTGNKFIFATVDNTTGFITVLLPPGRLVFDPQLSFYDKSYFTCEIGSTFYTNNDVIPNFPSNAKHLDDGITIKVADTVRTTWANKGGVDIIQDVYPVAFTKSGQIVKKWKFFNHPGGSFQSVQCQYLQDILISDPNDMQKPNSNDGPTILTRWTYLPDWEIFPSPGQPMPWFYIGYLHNLPNAPSSRPGLSGMGYLDYGAPLNLTKPALMVIGDWYSLASKIFGADASWPANGTPYSSGNADNAVLTVFPPTGVARDHTVVAGITSYGTGEEELCVGDIMSIAFYPHHFAWRPAPIPGHYEPDSIRVENFLIDESQVPTSTQVTLITRNKLFITDSLGKKDITQSENFSESEMLNTGGSPPIEYYNWWVRADQLKFCMGAMTDTMKITAQCDHCAPAFNNGSGVNECDLPIIVDCGEADVNPPQFTLSFNDSLFIDSLFVNDGRPTDEGLKSITWVAEKGTDTTKIVVTKITPAIKACSNDKSTHSLQIVQIDSTAGGCYDFTFTDCVGYTSHKSVCMLAHPLTIWRPDSLPPVFTVFATTGGHDTASCNRLSFLIKATDTRLHDSGMCSLTEVAGTAINMVLNKPKFNAGDGTISFSVSVIDSLLDGDICLRATDCSKEAHYTETCIQYCAKKDSIQSGVTTSAKYALSLDANHPNPFSHVTKFTYTIAEYGLVRLTLYDELGKELAQIVNASQDPGAHAIDFDGSRLAAGSYIVRLQSGDRAVSRKVVIER